MIPKQTQKVKPHMFMPGETVGAAIKKYNLYDVTADEMKKLIQLFTQINGQKNFKPGMRVMIPILEKHYATVFQKKS